MAYKIIPDSVRDFLSYDPETGVIKWKVTRGRAKAGDIAGYTNPSSRYRQIRFEKENWLEHRLAWFLAHGEQPDVIDHLNHNKVDNRLCNLRNVSKSANLLNREHSARGVCRVRGGWVAYIGRRKVYYGKSIALAHFHRYMAVTATHSLALPPPAE